MLFHSFFQTRHQSVLYNNSVPAMALSTKGSLVLVGIDECPSNQSTEINSLLVFL